MSAGRLLLAMVVGTVLVMYFGGRRTTVAKRPMVTRPVEQAWLTPDAVHEIVGEGGGPGPLFDQVSLGAPPAPEVQARIANFAKRNDVEIKLDVDDDGDLVAIRFGVTFGGCCGYERADLLAKRLGRPKASCCDGGDATLLDDWARVAEDGIQMRARVRVNRVAVRWEREVSIPELIERADTLVGSEIESAADTAANHWTEVEPHRAYLLEVPFPFDPSVEFGEAPKMSTRDDLGLHVRAFAGRITEVSFTIRRVEDPAPFSRALRQRFGRGHTDGDDSWTWKKPDRIVNAYVGIATTITITKRADYAFANDHRVPQLARE